MLYLKNGKTLIGGVCAKVAGNVETNHVTEYWPQGSRVRYANELINMQKHYNSSTKAGISLKFGHNNHCIRLYYAPAQCGVKRSKWGHLGVKSKRSSNDGSNYAIV